MKKNLIVTLAMFVLGSFGTVWAQDLSTAEAEASHQLSVTIPEVLFVQILGTSPAVSFDLSENTEAYLAAADNETAIGSSASTTMTDVQVWANQGWVLTVEAEEFVDAESLSIANIEVVPTGDLPLSVTSRLVSFRLNTTANVAEGGATGGWASVGISGSDYSIFVDGMEATGTHTTTVTYSVFAN
jgi:hypothetical protein